jgi:hypothetical protein
MWYRVSTALAGPLAHLVGPQARQLSPGRTWRGRCVGLDFNDGGIGLARRVPRGLAERRIAWVATGAVDPFSIPYRLLNS